MGTIDIEKLLHECNYPCISIVLPAGALDELHQSIVEAEGVMKKIDVAEETIRKVTATLLAVNIGSETEGAGVGIFVSPRVAGVISFPFQVNKKICVDQTFDTDYLIKALEYPAVPVS